MLNEFNFQIIDASLSVHNQQKQIRQSVQKTLTGWEGLPHPSLSARHSIKTKSV
jgi:hypothetical protein